MVKPAYKVETDKLDANSSGYVSASPLPTPEELSDFYANRYYQDSVAQTYAQQYDEIELRQRRQRADLVLYAVEQTRQQKTSAGRRFLEVGCGEGFVLAAAKSAGWDITGIDFSSHGVNSFHPDLAESLITGDAYSIFEDLCDNKRLFDACVIQNVLEHVIDPQAMLARLRGLLSPNGIVSINVPNDYSRLQELATARGHIEREFWFAPPEHLHYFNTENGPRFVESCGFKVVDMYADFPIDFFLFHPGSNYIADSANGKAAHRARLDLDLMLGEAGMPAYHAYYQALARCGAGRNFTMVARAND